MKIEIDTDDHDVEGIIWEIADFTNTFIEERTEKVSSEDLGLDNRIPKLRVGDNFIAVSLNGYDQKQLEYYGGFEYVDEEDIKYMGDYKFYFDSSDRVDCVLSKYRAKKEKV